MTVEGTVYITGAKGLVGQQICRVLGESGVSISTDMNLLGRRIDLESESLLNHLPESVNCIVHTAAAIPHQLGRNDDHNLYLTNRKIDNNILDCSKNRGIPVVYISSCGLYRRDISDLQIEESPIIPRTPYFQSKVEGEELFLQDQKSSVLRISAPFGPGMSERLVLSKFVESGIKNQAICVWGSGMREQNFISTIDVAQAVREVLERQVGGVFNIAGSEPTTMNQLATLVEENIGGFLVRSTDSDPHESERISISIEKAKQVLKWGPKHSLVDWLKKIGTDGQ
jgi:nucleoside-diphosphate-sugar epimerase